MGDSYTNLLYHVVFSTKDRQPLITPDYEVRLYDYIGGAIRDLGGISLALNGTDDHLHLLAKRRPDRTLSDVLRKLKANASGWLHRVFPRLDDFTWQRGYRAFTVSQSNVPEVRKYIAGQKRRHQKICFRDEFIQFLFAKDQPLKIALTLDLGRRNEILMYPEIWDQTTSLQNLKHNARKRIAN